METDQLLQKDNWDQVWKEKSISFIENPYQDLVNSKNIYSSRDNQIQWESINQTRKKIGISFNAGGIRGYITALIVQQMEQDLGMQLNQFIDVYSGVSIGCILSCLYSIGVSSDEIVNLFETQGDQIFKPKYYYKWGIVPIKGPRYCSDSLTDVLYSYLKDKKLNDVKQTLIGLVTDITDSSAPYGQIISNKDKSFSDITLLELALSSSAAPSYFKQQEINGKVYIDGGLSACSPALQCYSALNQLSQNDTSQDSILITVGTGIFKGDMQADTRSKWNSYYIFNGIEASMNANLTLIGSTASQMYKNTGNYFNLDAVLDQNIGLDDLTSLPLLKQAANRVIQSQTYTDCISKLKKQLQVQSDILIDPAYDIALFKDQYYKN